jgi:hypothetical protein
MVIAAEQYMRQHRLDVYFKDVAVRGGQHGMADEDSDAFKAEYFQTVAQGNHVIGRDYSFVSSVCVRSCSADTAGRLAKSHALHQCRHSAQQNMLLQPCTASP